METQKVNKKRVLTGHVVSDKMDKTVVVETEMTFKHPVIKKIMRRTKKYKVHDPKEDAKMGDVVEFYEGKPVSKHKYMYLSRVVRQNSVGE